MTRLVCATQAGVAIHGAASGSLRPVDDHRGQWSLGARRERPKRERRNHGAARGVGEGGGRLAWVLTRPRCTPSGLIMTYEISLLSVAIAIRDCSAGKVRRAALDVDACVSEENQHLRRQCPGLRPGPGLLIIQCDCAIDDFTGRSPVDHLLRHPHPLQIHAVCRLP